MASLRGAWFVSATDAFSSTGGTDRTGQSGEFGGVQFEFRGRRWLVPQKLRCDLGAAYFAKGDFLKYAPPAPDTADTKFVHGDPGFSF